jgi:hypothetical protein
MCCRPADGVRPGSGCRLLDADVRATVQVVHRLGALRRLPPPGRRDHRTAPGSAEHAGPPRPGASPHHDAAAVTGSGAPAELTTM